MKVVVASSNKGKLAEIHEILGEHIELVAQGDLGITDADETASTFVENALIKARNAARVSGLPALADDSGICVDALGGAPGLISALYAGRHGDNVANNAKLLGALRDVPDTQRTAHFHCTIVTGAMPIRHRRRGSLAWPHPACAMHQGWLRPGLLRTCAGKGRGRIDPTVKNRVVTAGALARLRERWRQTAESAAAAHIHIPWCAQMPVLRLIRTTRRNLPQDEGGPHCAI